MPWRVARWAALECRQNDVRGERDQFRGKCAIVAKPSIPKFAFANFSINPAFRAW